MTQEEFEKLQSLTKAIKDTKNLEESTFSHIKSLKNKLLKDTYLQLAVVKMKSFKGYEKEKFIGDPICKLNNENGRELLNIIIKHKVQPLQDKIKSLQKEFNSPFELTNTNKEDLKPQGV